MAVLLSPSPAPPRTTRATGRPSPIKINLYKPHPVQAQLLRERRRFNVGCLGRRSGKSTLSANLLCETALAGKFAGYFAPTYKLLNPVWRDVVKILAPITSYKNEQDRRLELITGGVIEFWSLDRDVARGRKYHLVIVDEAAIVAFLEQAWNEAIRPTLADYKGEAWFFSTPKGLDYFKALYDKGSDPFQKNWASWQLSSYSNPFIDPNELDELKEELPEDVYRQEVLAQFLEGGGSVFRLVRQSATIPHALDPYPGNFVMGVDFAQKNDFTVLTVLDTERRALVDIERFNQLDWETQRARITSMAQKWNVARIVAEENSIGSPNIEALQKAGLPVEGFKTTAQSKPQIIQSLVLAFEQNSIEIIKHPVLISELEAYEKQVNSTTGRISYNAPSGKHDDTVMSLAIGWWAVLNPPPKKKVIRALGKEARAKYEAREREKVAA